MLWIVYIPKISIEEYLNIFPFGSIFNYVLRWQPSWMSDWKVLRESSKWFLPGDASIGPKVSDKKNVLNNQTIINCYFPWWPYWMWIQNQMRNLFLKDDSCRDSVQSALWFPLKWFKHWLIRLPVYNYL